MASYSYNEETRVPVRLIFREDESPFLLDLSSLLYDLELLHDFSIILSFDEYSNYQFTQYFWNRNGRPLQEDQRIRLRLIQMRSPLTLELALGAPAALLAFIKAVEMVANWRLNRQKLRLELENLESERNIKRYDEEAARLRLENEILKRDASQVWRQLLRRLESNPIHLVDLELPTSSQDE